MYVVDIAAVRKRSPYGQLYLNRCEHIETIYISFRQLDDPVGVHKATQWSSPSNQTETKWKRSSQTSHSDNWQRDKSHPNPLLSTHSFIYRKVHGIPLSETLPPTSSALSFLAHWTPTNHACRRVFMLSNPSLRTTNTYNKSSSNLQRKRQTDYNQGCLSKNPTKHSVDQVHFFSKTFFKSICTERGACTKRGPKSKYLYFFCRSYYM